MRIFFAACGKKPSFSRIAHGKRVGKLGEKGLGNERFPSLFNYIRGGGEGGMIAKNIKKNKKIRKIRVACS